jgi:5,10-methylenetetrahydromethanopterin reductase
MELSSTSASSKPVPLECPVLTYDFRLPPGPRTVELALLAEELGFRAVWCPEVPAFGHDIWVTLARIAEKTKRLKFGSSVLIPSYRHPMAQASAIATLEQLAPGRLMVGFATGFTGRAGMGQKPLTLASMRTHITQVKALLRGEVVDIDGGLAQILASEGWLPDRPITVPIYMAGQGPRARALAKEVADGLISLGGPAEGFETCLVSTNGTVLDDGEDVTSPRAATALRPLIALAYHHRFTTDPENVKALPNGEAWLASVERVDKNIRHLSVHRGHNLDISNGHDALVDVSAAKRMTFTGTREELRERLARLEAGGATGIIFGTSGYDVERELRAYAEVAGLR